MAVVCNLLNLMSHGLNCSTLSCGMRDCFKGAQSLGDTRWQTIRILNAIVAEKSFCAVLYQFPCLVDNAKLSDRFHLRI